MSGSHPMLIVSLILMLDVLMDADVEPASVGRVVRVEHVLDDDRQPERGDDLKRRIDADDPVEHEPLQQIAGAERERDHDDEGEERVDAHRRRRATG